MLEQPQVQVGFASERGKRAINEDYVGAFTGTAQQRALQGITVAIADGVGGGSGGRQAAELSVRGFLDAYYGLPETLGVDRAAARALTAMNRWLHAQAHQDPGLRNMATTFSALILRGRQAHVVHVGDTRIYRLREHQLQRLTTDHVHGHPDMQHVLYRALGLEDSVRADYALHELNPHDRFLLCSDGVYGVLTDKRLHALLDRRSSPEDGARRIVDAALEGGSQDNVSALLLDVIGLPPPDQATLETALEALPIADLPKPGQEVDGFALGEVLADGRYSRLFQARDTRESREVVVKFPHPRVGAEAVHRQAFAREAWIAAQVHSPWVADMIELPPGRQSCLYSVMPHYRGETLERRLLRRPPVGLREGVALGIQLAKAVYALSRLRIIHRDIKPENVMLLEDGGLKLLDLGVARLPGIHDSTEPGAPGTPSYMAPELFRNQPGDERSDVYALGVSLYRMFSAGHYPYGEVEPFARPRFSRRTPLTQHRPDLPAWLDLVLARATELEPHRRFGDAMELAFELENGLARGADLIPASQPLYTRHPVRFWQTVAALLAAALLLVLAFG